MLCAKDVLLHKKNVEDVELGSDLISIHLETLQLFVWKSTGKNVN